MVYTLEILFLSHNLPKHLFLGNSSVIHYQVLLFLIFPIKPPQTKTQCIQSPKLDSKRMKHTFSHIAHKHNLQTIWRQILDKSLTYSPTSLITNQCLTLFNIPQYSSSLPHHHAYDFLYQHCLEIFKF
jgi:hypothetical protein